MEEQKQYLEPLTWLRAVAAFFVVVSHSIRASEVQYSASDEASHFFPLRLLDLGTFGVCLFFALSGCTLFVSSHAKISCINDFWFFYIKRFMRIWPAFALSLLMYLVFIEIFRYFYFADTSYWIAGFLTEYSLTNVLQYLSLTFNITGPRELFVSPYWSLPVEFQYYLLLPPALLLMKIKWFEYLSPFLFGSFLYLLYRVQVIQIDSDEVFKLGFTFFGGVLLAKYSQGVKYRLSLRFSGVIFCLVVLFVGSIRTNSVVVPEYIPFVSDKWNLYGVFALFSLFLALVTKPPVKRNMLIEFVHGYGEISYSIYLFHMLFIGIAALLVIHFGIYGNILKLLFVLIFSLVGSYIFSIYTYRYIELPSIKLGRKMSKYNSAN